MSVRTWLVSGVAGLALVVGGLVTAPVLASASPAGTPSRASAHVPDCSSVKHLNALRVPLPSQVRAAVRAARTAPTATARKAAYEQVLATALSGAYGEDMRELAQSANGHWRTWFRAVPHALHEAERAASKTDKAHRAAAVRTIIADAERGVYGPATQHRTTQLAKTSPWFAACTAPAE